MRITWPYVGVRVGYLLAALYALASLFARELSPRPLRRFKWTPISSGMRHGVGTFVRLCPLLLQGHAQTLV
ncbi:hypothetical protein F4803DRAFT_542445 [Xylaria telfairii]|nr:hypothetical protein F4803DRAFT_542445 [Xylaria telfairii]